MDKQEIKLEEERLLKKYIEFVKDYEKRVCSKCKGTQQQKDRECGILFGFKHFGCRHMTKNITKKMQPTNKILIEQIIKLHESRKNK